MKLTQPEIELFYKLWYALIWGINEKQKIVPTFKKPVYGERVNTKPIVAVRMKLWENPQWINEFLDDNDYGDFTETERGILVSWRDGFVKGRFFIMKHLVKYSVFMSAESPAKLYGVYGISDPIKESVYYPVPVMVEAVLLPFNDKIIYDSFIAPFSIAFGKGAREGLKMSYDEAKKTIGIIENMKISPVSAKPPVKKPKGGAS